jgi:hypothetical protein
MEPIGFPETSVRNYNSTLHKMRKSANLIYTVAEASTQASDTALLQNHGYVSSIKCVLHWCFINVTKETDCHNEFRQFSYPMNPLKLLSLLESHFA